MDSMADGQGRRLGDGGKRWQPITFADVEVGDEIKSVSPCGTVRKGVVTRIVDRWSLADRDWWVIGKPEWTLYRRAPNPAKFVPLDVPEVGQWIEATLRDGSVVAFQVTGRTNCRTWVALQGPPNLDFAHINTAVDAPKGNNDIISWRPTTPPAPAEPTGLGAVVAADGRKFIRLHSGRWEGPSKTDYLWSAVINGGPVTVLSEGVTS